MLDVSSSMVPPLSRVNRIDRARAELRVHLSTLTPEETFDIVAFFADIRPFRGAQVPATPENIAAAGGFLDSLREEDGTNFELALLSALRRRGVNQVVLITDGEPSQGQINRKKLTRQIREANVNHARIFTVGLISTDPRKGRKAFEKAARLLQQLSDESNGLSKLYPLG